MEESSDKKIRRKNQQTQLNKIALQENNREAYRKVTVKSSNVTYSQFNVNNTLFKGKTRNT